MAEFEIKYKYPFINKTSMLFLRDTDDTVMIWKVTYDQLKTFPKQLNEQHPTKMFDQTILKGELAFLETSIKTKTKSKSKIKSIHRSKQKDSNNRLFEREVSLNILTF